MGLGIGGHGAKFTGLDIKRVSVRTHSVGSNASRDDEELTLIWSGCVL